MVIQHFIFFSFNHFHISLLSKNIAWNQKNIFAGVFTFILMSIKIQYLAGFNFFCDKHAYNICQVYLLLVFTLLFYVKYEWCDLLFKNNTVGAVHWPYQNIYFYLKIRKGNAFHNRQENPECRRHYSKDTFFVAGSQSLPLCGTDFFWSRRIFTFARW